MSAGLPLWKVSSKRAWFRVSTSVLESLDCGENNFHWYTNLTTLPTFGSHFKIFISYFFVQYNTFWLFFSTPNSPCVLLPNSLPTQDHVSLSKKKVEGEKDNVESALSDPTTPGSGACPGVWLIDPVSLYQRKLIFPSPTGIDCNWHIG